MSDDTPTQRFEQPGDDTPTEMLPQAGAAPESPVEDEEKKKSRRLIIILASVGGALLIALIVLLVLLLTQGGAPAPAPSPTASSASPTPTPEPSSATPSATPTPTPTPTQTVAPPPPPPPPAGASVDEFTVTPDSVECNDDGSTVEIEIEWETSNADQIFFGVDTTDASAAPFFTNLPPSGNSSDFPPGYNPFDYSCPEASHTYTITAVNDDGTKDSVSIVVENTGFTG